MHAAAAIALTVLATGAAMSHAFAQSSVAPQRPGDPGYDTLLAVASAPLHEAFGEQVLLDVERLDRLGRWAFLLGTMHAPDGGRPDLAGSVYAERAAAGGMSDVYVALVHTGAPSREAETADADPEHGPGASGDAGSAARGADSPERWRLVDHAIGPSDVAWLEWPQQHAAPRLLFGF
ncbi:hypothetical protein [Luteimonas deserti]|nr:hypothetical protein [Luteimonas deserti]